MLIEESCGMEGKITICVVVHHGVPGGRALRKHFEARMDREILGSVEEFFEARGLVSSINCRGSKLERSRGFLIPLKDRLADEVRNVAGRRFTVTISGLALYSVGLDRVSSVDFRRGF